VQADFGCLRTVLPPALHRALFHRHGCVQDEADDDRENVHAQRSVISMQCRDRRLLRFDAAPQRPNLATSTPAGSRNSATKNPSRSAMSGSDMQAQTSQCSTQAPCPEGCLIRYGKLSRASVYRLIIVLMSFSLARRDGSDWRRVNTRARRSIGMVVSG